MDKNESMRLPLALLTSILLALNTAVGAPASINGKVVGVHDGDTITVLTPDNSQIKVRLNGIDAPESRQPFGDASKKLLSAKVFDRSVRLAIVDTDKYGRTVADVYVGTIWINEEMVATGMAWRFVAYSKDPRLIAAEKRAQTERLGLWKDSAPVPPWEFRANARPK
jgi:endonuclease YncB( thermonuclease family)